MRIYIELRWPIFMNILIWICFGCIWWYCFSVIDTYVGQYLICPDITVLHKICRHILYVYVFNSNAYHSGIITPLKSMDTEWLERWTTGWVVPGLIPTSDYFFDCFTRPRWKWVQLWLQKIFLDGPASWKW